MQDTSIALIESLVENNDQLAWRRFFETYAPRMENWLVRKGVNADLASDIRQEAMVTLVEQLPKFQHNDHLGAFRCWIDRIVQNAWRKVRRRRQAMPVDDALLQELEDENGELSQLLREDYARHGAELVQRELELLASELQSNTIEAFVRTTLHNQSIEQTAAELSMTRGAIATACSRVRAKLRERLQLLISESE